MIEYAKVILILPMRPEWKILIGRRLKELRQRAHGGKGYSQEIAAKTIGRSRDYIIKLENHLAGENPTLGMLEQLCSLYGVTVIDLFKPLIHEVEAKNNKLHAELKEKLDFILTSGVEKTVTTITENIHAGYERARSLKKQ